MSEQTEDTNFSHKIYKNDPTLFISYVEKEVKITMKDGNVQCGVIYTIDPVSESIVLLQSGESTQYKLKIISGHAIENIEVTSEAKTDVPELFLPVNTKLSLTAMTKRKNIVMQLLLDNRFPVREEGDALVIENIMSIDPPYYPENCACTNSIILSRIQNILTRASVE